MDHVIVLLVGFDGFVILQFIDDRPIRCDAKSTLEKHLVVRGNNICVSIVEVLGICHRFICAIGPCACATIEVGIAGGAMLPPEEQSPMSGSIVLQAVPVVIVSATIIPSIAVVVFIVGVLPVASLSSCPPHPHPDCRRCCVNCCCRCHQCVRSLPSCPPLPLLIAVVIVNVSACCRCVRHCHVACCCHRVNAAPCNCCGAFEVKAQQMYKMKTPLCSPVK